MAKSFTADAEAWRDFPLVDKTSAARFPNRPLSTNFTRLSLLPKQRFSFMLRYFGLVVIAVLMAAKLQAADDDSSWTTPGKDPQDTRYSALDQINATNAANLKVAWT